MFSCGLGRLVILSDRELHQITCDHEYIPIFYNIQDHFHKSFEVLMKTVACG